VKVSVSNRGEEGTIEVSSTGTIWVVYNNDFTTVGPTEYVYAVNSTDGGTTWSATAEPLSSSGILGGSIEVARTALAAGPNGKMLAVWDNTATGIGTDIVRLTQTSLMHRVAGRRTRERHGRYEGGKPSREPVLHRGDRQQFERLRVLPYQSPLGRPTTRDIVMHKKAWDAQWSPVPTSVIESHPTVGQRSICATVDSSNVLHLTYDRDLPADTSFGLDEIVYTFSMNGGLTWSPACQSAARTMTVGIRPWPIASGAPTASTWHGGSPRTRFSGDSVVTAVLHANVPYSLVNNVEDNRPLTFETLSNYPIRSTRRPRSSSRCPSGLL